MCGGGKPSTFTMAFEMFRQDSAPGLAEGLVDHIENRPHQSRRRTMGRRQP